MPDKSKERTKRFILKIEDDETRTVTAQFATFNVVDLDGDITEPGAFGDQDVFMGAWNHNPHMLPPGMGKTFEEGDAALFRGNFFKSQSGQDHYELIKAAGGQMEWSYRFFIEDGEIPIGEDNEGDDKPFFVIRRAKITHVAPVEAGAGIGTQTVDIKCVDCDAKNSPKSSEPFDYERLGETIVASLAKNVQINFQEVYSGEDFAKAVQEAIDQRFEKDGCPGNCSGSCGDSKGASEKGEGLGAHIRDLRDERELSNEQLADAAGVSVGTIGQILGGTIKCPRVEWLEGIARLMSVNLSSLIAVAEKDGCDNNEIEEPSNDEGQQSTDPDDAKSTDPAAESTDDADDPADPEDKSGEAENKSEDDPDDPANADDPSDDPEDADDPENKDADGSDDPEGSDEADDPAGDTAGDADDDPEADKSSDDADNGELSPTLKEQLNTLLTGFNNRQEDDEDGLEAWKKFEADILNK